MAKKNKKSPAVVAVAAPVVVEQPIAVVEQSVTVPVVADAPVPVFAVAKPEFKPARGFETLLFTELKTAPGTAQQLVERLLASGEYQRIAPRAAELRPAKPVLSLLKSWKTSGVLVAA